MIPGLLLALCQAWTWAGTSIILRKLSAEHDAMLLNGLRSVVGLVVVLPLVWVMGQQAGWAALTPTNLLYIVGACLAGGAIGDGLYIAVLDMIGVSRGLLISNSSPVFALALSALLLGERITWLMVLGIALVLLGVALAVWPAKSARAAQSSVNPRRLWLGVGLATLVAFLWAGAAVVIALGLKTVTPMVVNSIRMTVVAVASLGAAGARGKLGDIARFRGKKLGTLIAAGLLGSAGSATLYLIAISLIGPSRVTTVNAAVPLFGAVLSYIFLKERLTPIVWVGTALTVAGLVLVAL
jgi:bacterial/archaeal transporter family protein